MVDIVRPEYGTSWAKSGEKIIPETVKIELGWVQEMMPFQYENWLQNRQDEAISYMLQKGIPEYLPTQEYIANKSVVLHQGAIYMATQTVTGVAPNVQASWKRISSVSNNDGVISVSGGGTGATTAEQARLNLGLGSAALLDASLVVQKDVNGNFTAGTITASLNGVAASAMKLSSSRSITLTGAVTSTAAMFDGSSNITIVTTSVNASNISGQIPLSNLGSVVAKTSEKGSAVLPAGPSSDRDSSPNEGYIRFNTGLKLPEFWNGTAWIAQNGTDLAGMIGTGPAQVSTNTMLDARNVNGAKITGQVPAASLEAAVIKTSPTGSAMLPFGSTGQRDSSPAFGYVRGNSSTSGLEWYNGSKWNTITDSASGEVSSNATRLKAILDLGQKDPYLLIQGDSTGNEDWEFFFLTVQKLCAMYPTHTVYYRTWNPDTKVWDARTLQTGTTSRVLRIYNGSVPGATPSYWQGVNKDYAYDGFQFDMIIVNYGLNVTTSSIIQKSSLASCLYTLRSEQPDAEILVNIQCPDYTNPDMLSRSQMRSDTQRQVIGEFGVASVDVFNKFSELVNGSSVESWYSDKIHPNPAGQLEWSNLLLPRMLRTTSFQKTADFRPTLIPNGNFTRWYAGYPVWWTWSTSNTVFKETSIFETSGFSVKVNGTGANTGLLFVQAGDAIRSMQHMPQIVFAARVRTTGSTHKPGTLWFSTGSSATGDYREYTGDDNGWQGVGSGRWKWVFLVLPREVFLHKDYARFGIMSGQAGESVLIDRVICGGSVMIADSNITDGYSSMYEHSDGTFDVPANSTVNRQIGNEFRPGLQLGASVEVTGPVIPSGVIVQARMIDMITLRISFINTTSASVTIPAGQWQVLVK